MPLGSTCCRKRAEAIEYWSILTPDDESVSWLERGIAGRTVSGSRNLGMLAPGSVGVANADAVRARAQLAPAGISRPPPIPALYARNRLRENPFIASSFRPIDVHERAKHPGAVRQRLWTAMSR